MLRRLAYVSYPAADFSSTEVGRIVQVSRVNNAARGITGVLVYTGCDFAQLIEGRHDAVETLWQKLRADPRHRDLEAFIDEPAERAWFETWRMGYLYDDTLSRQIAEWRTLRARLARVEHDAVRSLMAEADAF
jgi:hypothetical protein